MSWMDRLGARTWPKDGKRVVSVLDDGFSLLADGTELYRVHWASVVELVAFKHDLFSVDEICLGFRCEGDERFLWAGEEDENFSRLRGEVECRFNGIPPDWFNRVAVPPFAENWTSLWRSGS